MRLTLETGNALTLTLDDAQRRVALGCEIGELQIGLIECLLRARKRVGRFLQLERRFGAMLGIAFLGGLQFALFAAEPFEDSIGVADRLFLAAEIGHRLDEAGFEFLTPGFGALFFGIEI